MHAFKLFLGALAVVLFDKTLVAALPATSERNSVQTNSDGTKSTVKAIYNSAGEPIVLTEAVVFPNNTLKSFSSQKKGTNSSESVLLTRVDGVIINEKVSFQEFGGSRVYENVTAKASGGIMYIYNTTTIMENGQEKTFKNTQGPLAYDESSGNSLLLPANGPSSATSFQPDF